MYAQLIVNFVHFTDHPGMMKHTLNHIMKFQIELKNLNKLVAQEF